MPEQLKPGHRSLLIRLASVAVLVTVAIGLTIYLASPPAAVGEGEPATEFSSARALKHLNVIAQRPRPVGSAEHRVAFDYLVQEISRLNGPPEVQTAKTEAAALQNILARVKGSNSGGKALMLVAHYDSVRSSPGANDDGSGVVTLLETLRAIKAGPPLQNDVIFLFTDGEELGMLGARAFVDEHAWSKEVGLALNFEARGGYGPVFMFETSRSNGRLIEEFSRAAPRPFSNSLMNEFYKMLSNDTDLSVLMQGGMAGLNFAYVGGPAHYHNARDSVANVDARSVQHHGSYALALTRHFGNLDLRNIAAPDVIYFDLLGRKLFSYGHTFNLVLTGVLLLLGVGLVVVGLRGDRLRFSGVVGGLVLFLLSLGCALAVAMVFTQISLGVILELVLLTTITVVIMLAIQIVARRRLRVDERSAGALLALVVLAVAINVALPGGGFLLTWPLLFALIALGISFVYKFPSPYLFLIVLAVCSLPAIVLFTQMLHNVFQGFNLSAPHLLALLEGLLLGLLLPFSKYIEAS